MNTRVLVVAGTRIRPVEGAVPWVSPAAAPGDGLRVLLGEQGGRAWFALIGAGEGASIDAGWFPLRGLLPHLATAEVEGAPLIFHALGIAEWLFVTRFCPRCGGALEARKAGHELACSGCGRAQFPRGCSQFRHVFGIGNHDSDHLPIARPGVAGDAGCRHGGRKRGCRHRRWW